MVLFCRVKVRSWGIVLIKFCNAVRRAHEQGVCGVEIRLQAGTALTEEDDSVKDLGES